MLCIEDRKVGIFCAIEALRLFDHFYFRVKANESDAPAELRLAKPPLPGRKPWFSACYRNVHLKQRDRQLFGR